eukprot:Partr_v1_DN27869_c1_g1_i1_m22503
METIENERQESFESGPFHVYYCLCSEPVLILEGRLRDLARRRTDNAFILPTGRNSRINLRPAGMHMIRRTSGGQMLLERHYALECPYCELPIAYSCGVSMKEAEAVYFYHRSLSSKQGKYPGEWTRDIMALADEA